MGRYRKVDSRIWNDAGFMALSDDAKLTFLFIMTHPGQTSLGAMRASVPGLAAELRWTEKRFLNSLSESLAKKMIQHDASASFLWLPNFLKYNRPESPNVIRSWGNSLDLIPECTLKHTLMQSVSGFVADMPQSFNKVLPDAFRAPVDTLSETPEESGRVVEEKTAKPPEKTPDTDDQFEEFWAEYPRKTGKGAARTKWKQIKPSKKKGRDIIDAVKAQKRDGNYPEPDPVTRKDFRPYPATWLNRGQWDDELRSAAPEQVPSRLDKHLKPIRADD